MGGPCDAKIQGKTAEEIMHHGGDHVKHWANKGDDAHRKVLQKMEAMQKDPKSPESKAWDEKFHKDFAALPNG
jgi:hypothetical protein